MTVRAGVTMLAMMLAAAPGLAQDDILAHHETCVLDGRANAVCAEVLTGHCLDTSDNLSALTRCRAGLAEALEGKAALLARTIGATDPGLRTRAIEIIAGADRIVAAYCGAYAGRVTPEETAGHDIRCALMAGHVKVYHLLRLRADLEEET